MAKDRIEKNDVIDPGVVKEISNLNKELAESVKLMATLTKSAIDLNRNFSPDNIQQVVDSQNEYNKVNEESQKQNKETLTTLEKLQQKIKEVNEEEERAKIALQEKRKEIRENIKAQKDQTKETVKLNRELRKEIKTEKEATEQNKRLRKARKEVDTTTAKGAKQISLINKKIDQNNELIEKNASKLGKQKIGVGKYKEGITEALKEQELFGVSINKVSSALSSGVGIVGAVTAAIGALGKVYTSSARGAEDMAKASDRLRSITKSLGNSLADVTGEAGIMDAVIKALQITYFGLANTLESDVQVSILSTIRQLEIMEAEQERQKKSQLNRAEELRQIRDEERNSLEERKKANDELGEVINEREKDTIEFQEKILSNLKKLLEFNEGDLELQRQIKQVEFEIADAREEAQGFRSEQLINDLALSREFIANELQLQKLRIEEEIELEEEGSQKRAELRKKIIDITKELELQAAGENEQLRKIAIQKAINDEIRLTDSLKQEGLKRLENTLELQAKANEQYEEHLAERSEIEIEALAERIEKEKELIDKGVANQQAADQAKAESTKMYVDFAVTQAQALSDAIFSFQSQELENQVSMDIEKAKARGATEAEIREIEKKAAKERQQIAVKQALINGALGITNAIATAPSIIVGLILAAVVATTTALNIASIKSQKFAKGTKDSGSKGQIAWVGEQGTERVNLSDGSTYLTPNKATLTYLPPHSEVVPNHQLQQDLAEMQSIRSSHRKDNEDKQRKKEHQELIKAIKKRDETYINITEGGFSVIATKGQTRTKYIDRVYRGKK